MPRENGRVRDIYKRKYKYLDPRRNKREEVGENYIRGAS
jgi:hypothetical protein